MLLLEAHNSLYFHRAHTLFNCMFECVYCFEKFLLRPIASAWSPPLTVLSQSAYFLQFHVWMCVLFQKNSFESHSFSLKPTTHCTFTEPLLCSIVCLNVYNVSKKFLLRGIASAWSQPLSELSQSAYIVQLCVWMCRMFWKISSETHYFCLKPTAQCTFTERILCSIVRLNVYSVLKIFFWDPLLLLEVHHSLYFHRALTFFNFMFECVYCFKKILLKAIPSPWSPPLTVLSQSHYFVQLYVWMCIMFQKNFFCEALLLLEANHSVNFHRAHTLFNCVFECVGCFEKFLLKPIASAWSPPISVFSQNAYFVQFHVWMCIMFQKNSSESHSFSLKPTTHCTFTEPLLCSIICLNVYIVLKNFSWNPLLLLEAHHSVYFHRKHTLFNCMFECV